MTQNEKDLLIKDLCARLPYGVWIERKLKSCKFGAKCMLHAHDIDAIERGQYDFYKPYLFPLDKISGDMWSEYLATCVGGNASFPTLKSFEWCNEHHVDYRGLIPMGLALDATGLNIY